MYKVEEYRDERGNLPFRDWLKTLDVVMRAKITARIFRLESGNFGDTKSIDNGVFEARIHLGPGYRVYFGLSDNKLIILLMGGAKKSQARDIRKAKLLWSDWKENN